jgi:hypothetical protein
MDVSGNEKCKFFFVKDLFKRMMIVKLFFLQNLNFLIVKNQLPLQFVDNVWFKHVILHLCPQVVFPSKKQFSYEILLKLVEKMKQLYVLPKLGNYIFTTSFDLWMSKAHVILLLL